MITLYRTLRYLKPVQLLYRGKLVLFHFFPIKVKWDEYRQITGHDLCFENSISFTNSYINFNSTFSFLNLSHSFSSGIDWNWLGYGKLWTYNLNYFEYLNQEHFSIEDSIALINDFLNQLPSCSVGLEPYPLSLRCVNWIRFFIKYKLNDKKYDTLLFQQLELLTHRLEYHILGN